MQGIPTLARNLHKTVIHNFGATKDLVQHLYLITFSSLLLECVFVVFRLYKREAC